ncbi:hypothetical protein FACS1894172_16400 [Spirochaetia bacterium]|nr:hypothetical protein FACS1894164_09490 [Spirochaetia bacterium]GHU35115.1 hypothetical protein FACS1894172_16400 [Spirochaetia bacterium]
MKNNKHSQAIPIEVLTEVQTKIDEASTLLKPYLIALTPKERQKLPKMGSKTLSFVEKALDFSKQNQIFNPSYLDIDAFSIDFNDAHELWALVNSVEQLYANLDDTEMVAGSEAFQAALLFYNSVKLAAAQDVPGAKTIYDELKNRFPRGKHKKRDI